MIQRNLKIQAERHIISLNIKSCISETIAVSATWLERAFSWYPPVLQMKLKARVGVLLNTDHPRFSSVGVKSTFFRDPAGDEDNRLGSSFFYINRKPNWKFLRYPPSIVSTFLWKKCGWELRQWWVFSNSLLVHTAGSQIAQMNPTFYYCKQSSNSCFCIARLKSNIGFYIVCLGTVEEDKDTW